MNGTKAKHMAMVCISGKMEIDLKENGECALNTAQVQIYSSMVMYTQVIT